MSNLKSHQTSGTRNVFIDTHDNNSACLPIDFLKPPKFDDPLLQCSKTSEEIEALHPLLMVMLGSRILSKISEISWILNFMHTYFLNIH